MNTDCFFTLTYGLFILSSTNGVKFNGHINNTCFQVTAEPAQFAVCTHKNNLTTDYIKSSKVFAISLIHEIVVLNYIGHWGFKSGRDFDKFKDVPLKKGITGAPIVLVQTIAYLECSVVKEIDVGTHIIFIGEVKEAVLINNVLPPFTYSYYRNVIKGLSPKNAPTYINKSVQPENVKTKSKSLRTEQEVVKEEFICSVCGYVYDPEEGDPTANIEPGTSFHHLPKDWTCPFYAVRKDMSHLFCHSKLIHILLCQLLQLK